VGGVSIENIREYARVGAAAVGLGGNLVVDGEQSEKDLILRARALREAWDLNKR
jgi:2-keto-3-deoxy-6-phosphogluconate aldolase